MARVVVVLVCLGASAAAAQYCPSHDDGPPKFTGDNRPPPRGAGGQCFGGGGPPPPMSGGGGPPPGSPGSPGGSSESGAESAGDPATFFATRAYTFDRVEDVMVQTSLGPISFQRSYVSSDLPWRGGRVNGTPTLQGVPKPFGASRIAGDVSQRWSHNFFAFADVRLSEWRVRTPRGTEELFGSCGAGPCWAARYGQSEGELSRLQRRSDGSFLFLQNDGKQYVFGAATEDGGMYFLSEVRDSSGTLVASVNYARPTASCSGFLGLSDAGVPYVSTITTPGGGPTLQLTYSTLGSSQCVVTGVNVNGGAATAYAYQDGVPGHLIGATTPQFVEAYSGYQTSFAVVRDSGTLVMHVLDAGTPRLAGTPPIEPENVRTVVRIEDTTGVLGMPNSAMELNVPFPDGGTEWCPAGGHYVCCDADYSRRIDVVSALRGDGSGLASSYSQRFYFSAGATQSSTEGHQPEVRVDLCAPGDYACSPGHIRWLWQGSVNVAAGCGASNPAVATGVMDKRRNWTLTPVTLADAGAGVAPAFAQTALLRGVPSNTTDDAPDAGVAGANALETTNYAHTYINGVQYLSTEKHPSALTGGEVVTTYVRDSNGRLTGTFVTGSTTLLNGTVRGPIIIGWLTHYDSLGRVDVEEGPCEVTSLSATTCPGANDPKTTRSYHASGTSAGQLWKVSRYIDSTNTLVTEFLDYTALGEPQRVIDENGVETRFTYEGHQVRTSEIEAGAVDWRTEYTWENERLTAIKYPQGNFEQFCYRAVTSPDGVCSGAWTGKLHRHRRSASETGASDWSEAIVYTYRIDGTLSSETTFMNGVADAGVTRSYAADAHKRPSWERTGNATTGFVEVRGFDPADNQRAIGRPFNVANGFNSGSGAPAYCVASGGALSSLCAQMTHDRADRIRELDVYPTGSGSPERVCIDYDKRGNVSRVATGCSSACSLEATPDSSSSCSGQPATSYLTDDFGNVVKVEGAGAFNASTGQPGILRLEYDALGNVVKQQSEAQRNAAHVPIYLSFQYDKLGRETQRAEVWSTTPYVVSAFTYDENESPDTTCDQPQLTKGRLRKSWDPLMTRWYQYDQAGRVTREIRIPNDTSDPTPACATDQLDLILTYTTNGNVAQMTYGHGRVVKYEYGTGALTDRVATVKTEKFIATDGGTSTQTVVDQVTWEPFGGLRSYRLNFASGTGDVVYEPGNSTASASDCQTGAMGEASDQSGRLRSIRVSYPNGGATTELYRRTYRWKANEIRRIATCYKADNQPVIEDFDASDGGASGYDFAGRLKGAVGYTNYNAGSTTVGSAHYTFDGRGNISNNVVNTFGHKYANTYATGNANSKDQLVSSVSNVGGSTYDSFIGSQFLYDSDGRTIAIYGPPDSSGSSAYLTQFQFDSPIGPGAQSAARYAFRQVGPNSVGGVYWFDNQQRRQAKQHPLNELMDLFLYAVNSNQLLEDRGNVSLTSSNPTTFPIDEYIWLGGRPVAIYRALLTKQTNGAYLHGIDGSGGCMRNGQLTACGMYFVVTDHLSKPVLTIDSAKKISGVGEYDAYGHINRVVSWFKTAHPYSTGVEGPSFSTIQQLAHGGLSVAMRVHFKVLDTDANEGPSLWSVTSGGSPNAMLAAYAGHHQGEKWSDWFGGSTVGSFRMLKLGWGTVSGNCPPTGACSPATWPYSGFATSEFEYQRFESSFPYFPPIRFPGHYYDEETDLFENWHRNYSPATGRYLSPEPLLQASWWSAARAEDGSPSPVYAFSASNPIVRVDRNGLQEESPSEIECMAKWEKQWAEEKQDDLCFQKHKSKDGCFLIKQAARLSQFRLICQDPFWQRLERAFDPPDAGSPAPKQPKKKPPTIKQQPLPAPPAPH